MHELPYEPPTLGAGDSRRLARWLAAWTVVVFGLIGVGNLVAVASTAIAFGSEIVLTGLGDSGYELGYAISGLALPLAAAALAVWLMTGRVVVWLLASVPTSVAAGGVFFKVSFMAEYGVDWFQLAWMPVEAGYLLLGLLFLTPTFRRAINAPRPGR